MRALITAISVSALLYAPVRTGHNCSLMHSDVSSAHGQQTAEMNCHGMSANSKAVAESTETEIYSSFIPADQNCASLLCDCAPENRQQPATENPVFSACRVTIVPVAQIASERTVKQKSQLISRPPPLFLLKQSFLI